MLLFHTEWLRGISSWCWREPEPRNPSRTGVQWSRGIIQVPDLQQMVAEFSIVLPKQQRKYDFFTSLPSNQHLNVPNISP